MGFRAVGLGTRRKGWATLDDAVGCVGGWVFEFLAELVLEFFKLFSWRVWFTLGVVGAGVFAITRAVADERPGHPAVLFLAGASLLLSPVALFLWPDPPR
jgi:hypothetical protein